MQMHDRSNRGMHERAVCMERSSLEMSVERLLERWSGLKTGPGPASSTRDAEIQIEKHQDLIFLIAICNKLKRTIFKLILG